MSELSRKHLIEEFNNLAAVNKDERMLAINKFVSLAELDEEKEYVVSRLIASLASAQAASRYGCSTALVLILKKFRADFPVEKLFEIADKKLDLKSQTDSSKNAIGYHLLCTSCYFSGKYAEDTDKLLQKQLKIVSEHTYLKASVVESIVSLCNDEVYGRDSDTFFQEYVLPTIRPGLSKPFKKMSPEEFLLLVGLKDKFSKILKKQLNVPLKKNYLVIQEEDFPTLIELLKAANKCLKIPLILAIFRLARETKAFPLFYEKIVKPYLLHGDESKAINRFFELLNQLLVIANASEFSKITIEELFTIFDEVLVKNIRKYSHRTDPRYRGVHLLIGSLLMSYQNCITKAKIGSKLDQVFFKNLLRLLDNVEGGDFDTKVGCQVKFSEFLVNQLDAKSLDQFVDESLLQDSWSLRRIEHSAFKSLDIPNKVKILTKIVQYDSSVSLFNTVCNLIDQCFVVKFRRFQFMGVGVSEDIQVFEQVVANIKTSTKIKTVDNDLRPLKFFSFILKILSAACPDREEKYKYLSDAKESSHCSRKFNGAVFVDLLLSVLVRKNRANKAIVYYVFSALASKLSTDDVRLIVETIGKTDSELSGEGEEDDDEFQPITEEDLHVLQKLKNTNEVSEEVAEDETSVEESDDDIETDDSVGENDDAVVNPKLIQDLQKALGKSACLDDNEEDDHNEMSESEMQRLDDALANAFRKNSSKEKRLHKEELRVFRNKCFDLLNIFFSEAHVDVILPLEEDLKLLDAKFLKDGVKEFQQKIRHILLILVNKVKKNIKLRGVKRKLEEE